LVYWWSHDGQYWLVMFLLKICIWSIPLHIIVPLIPPNHQFRVPNFAVVDFFLKSQLLSKHAAKSSRWRFSHSRTQLYHQNVNSSTTLPSRAPRTAILLAISATHPQLPIIYHSFKTLPYNSKTRHLHLITLNGLPHFEFQ